MKKYQSDILLDGLDDLVSDSWFVACIKSHELSDGEDEPTANQKVRGISLGLLEKFVTLGLVTLHVELGRGTAQDLPQETAVSDIAARWDQWYLGDQVWGSLFVMELTDLGTEIAKVMRQRDSEAEADTQHC